MTFFTLFRNPLWRGAWLGLACAVLAALLASTAFFNGIDEWLFDSGFFFRDFFGHGGRPTQANIIIIGLDEPSLEELDKPLAFVSPQLADVIDYVNDQGARAVGVDLLVPENMSQFDEIENENGKGNAHEFNRAVCQAGNVVLPVWKVGGDWEKPLLQWQVKALRTKPPDPTDLAAVNLTADGDQFIRRQTLLFKGENQTIVPHFALALFARAHHTTYEWDDERRLLFLDGRQVPLDDEQRLRINYVSGPNRFPVVSFQDVLAAKRAGRAMPEFQGATVILGVTTPAQQDFHSTPYANTYASIVFGKADTQRMSGPEIHANILATLEDRAYIRSPPRWLSLAVLAVSGVVLGMLFARLKLAGGFVLTLGHHFGWKLLALAAFSLLGWRLPLMEILLLGFLAYAGTFFLRWLQLRQMLGVVKSATIAQALEADPGRLYRGDEQEITILFADVRSFADYCDRRRPQEVVALLNTYYTAVVPAIEQAGGTVANYMGDGIMVWFGAPAACTNHAAQAVRAAVAMVQAVQALARKGVWEQHGFAGMRIGVGVHTGKVVVGAIGSPGRLDYTAIGTAVNAAARIEAETKTLYTPILISAATYQQLTVAERAACGCAAEAKVVLLKGIPQPFYLYPVDGKVEPWPRGGSDPKLEAHR